MYANNSSSAEVYIKNDYLIENQRFVFDFKQILSKEMFLSGYFKPYTCTISWIYIKIQAILYMHALSMKKKTNSFNTYLFLGFIPCCFF